jgi:hypothetical protein
MLGLMEEVIQRVYESILESGREWRIAGVLQRPSYDDVAKLIDNVVTQVKKSPTPISVEVGGLLVKNTDGHIDIYAWIGEA